MPRRTQPKERRSRPKRHLGQNFLVDASILDQITSYVEIQPGDTVVEIGAGTGLLTTRLASEAGKLIAIEVDSQLCPQLESACASYPNVQLICADVLKLDLTALIEDTPAEYVRVVGNLPYYITTPILMRLLALRSYLSTCVLMLQLEVAERLVAPPGNRIYGAPSVAVAYHTQAELLRRVPASAFRPQPKVESAVLRLRMRRQPAVDVSDEEELFQIVRGAFQHRRKMLRNALLQSGIGSDDPERLDRALSHVGIAPTVRPETLGIEEYAKLTNALHRS